MIELSHSALDLSTRDVMFAGTKRIAAHLGSEAISHGLRFAARQSARR
jgi:hypothetical protein